METKKADKKFEFDYGVVEIGHRLNINRAINHEKIVLTGCIRMGFVKKLRNNADTCGYWEIQIIHKPNAPENPTELFKGSLDDYTIDIKHKGNMQVQL